MRDKIIYALGYFDGVHRGHQALLDTCRRLAKERDCHTGVVTFEGHPDTLVLGKTPKLINTPEDRLRLLKSMGVESVVVLPFDRAMMEMPWQEFYRMLKQDYNADGLVCGYDFRFGSRGEGSGVLLKQACEADGLICEVTPEQEMDQVTVSSTYIRTLLEAGDMITAIRRILCSASEDVGMAYPMAVPIVKACVDNALQLGLPEARLPLAEAVVLLATSPKSNTVHDGINAAMADVRAGKVGGIPRHLQNVHADSSGMEQKQNYKYPHNYPHHWVAQQYLPDELVGTRYYAYGENKTEQAARRYWEEVKGKQGE